MFADPHRMGKLGQPAVQPLQCGFLKRMEISPHLFSLRIVPLAQFRNQLKEPCQPIRSLKTGSSFSSEICSLLHDVFCGETLEQCFASRLNEGGIRKSSHQANEEPMPVDRRMPVVAAIESRGQFPWWCRVCIAIQGMANVVWILFVDARDCKIGEPVSRFYVELACILGGSTHREEQKHGAESQSHRLIL